MLHYLPQKESPGWLQSQRELSPSVCAAMLWFCGYQITGLTES